MELKIERHKTVGGWTNGGKLANYSLTTNADLPKTVGPSLIIAAAVIGLIASAESLTDIHRIEFPCGKYKWFTREEVSIRPSQILGEVTCYIAQEVTTDHAIDAMRYLINRSPESSS